MSEPFLGQLMTVGFNYAPRGWAFASGQILSIAQNSALFALFGTTYGGNGQTTFALPNLNGRAALGQGQLAGGSTYTLGQVGGTENTTLTINNMPAHTHTITPTTFSGINIAGTKQGPQPGGFLARGVDAAPTPASIPWLYIQASEGTGQTQVPFGGVSSAANTGIIGNNVAFSTMQPYLVLNQIVALQGVFPSRN